jgi:hypothetical protein
MKDAKLNLSWKKSPQDLDNLLSLDKKILAIIYPECKHLRTTQLKYQRLVKEGKIKMPPKNQEWENDPNPEREKARSEARRGRVAKSAGETATSKLITIQVLEEHALYHEKLKKHLEEEGHLTKVTFTDWEMGYKDADGEASSIPLHGTRFEIAFDSEPKWPPVTQIKGERLPKKEAKTRPDGGKRAVIMPDLQLPYVDEKALSVALQVIQDVKPDQIIFIGDTLDLSAWSKYVQRPEFADATRGSFIQLYELLFGLRADNRHAEIIVLEGNHEARMDKDLLINAQHAHGLKKVTEPEGWPVMSVPNLCDFESIDIQYIPGYPANRFWLNERLQIIHGDLARPNAKSAKAVVNRERVSTIFGHTHRRESATATSQDYHGGKQHSTYNIGCLCRLDGAVPSGKTGYDPRTGRNVENYMDWAHGLMVVDYLPGDKPFHAQQVEINTFDGYQTRFNGKFYEPWNTNNN